MQFLESKLEKFYIINIKNLQFLEIFTNCLRNIWNTLWKNFVKFLLKSIFEKYKTGTWVLQSFDAIIIV